MMMMTMMTNTIPYRCTKLHIWDFVRMGFWASAVIILILIVLNIFTPLILLVNADRLQCPVRAV